MKRMTSTLLGLALLATLATACGPLPPPGAVFVEIGPPPARYEVAPVQPGPEFIWVAGYWGWVGTEYQWMPGRWVERPQPRAHWVPGRWVRAHGRGRGYGGGWYWVEGRWDY